MIRQSTPPDRDMLLRVPVPDPAPVATQPRLAYEPPPVVIPRRLRIPIPEMAPVGVPSSVVDAAPVASAIESRGSATLWAPPVPTFTYLAGAAGSGKTYATRVWAEEDPSLLLCATTGIAAINLGGETINSVLGYFDTHSMQEAFISGYLTTRLGRLWKAGVKRLVLDEVSMLAGDQLTFLVKGIEEVNGRGYVLGKWTDDDDMPPPQMGLTLVGDFLQLAPVKASYAFESPEWERFTPNVITLTDIRRQDDRAFIEMLRAARVGNGKAVADYFAARNAIMQETDDRYEGPTILAKNEAVDRYNYLRLSQVPGADLRFASHRWGKLRSEWGQLEKPENTWGIPKELALKEGALVMVLANFRDEERRLLYVNGDLGTVHEADEDGTAHVTLQRTGETVKIEPVTRHVKIPCDSARRKELRETGQSARIDGKWEVVGSITYMPLRVAYASTVHKSQGLSLDRVQVNIRDPFFKSPGMLYVALSRARTAEGLRLVGSPQALVERCVSDPRLRNWL